MVTVRRLLAAAEIVPAGQVMWGDSPTASAPGVYLVSMSRDSDEEAGLPHCPVDRAAIRALLQVRPEATVDGEPATEESVVERLRRMWVPGEPVVYIGLAGTSVSDRVTKYYRTRIGARAPHAGGWPIKMLSNLDQLWVHYAPCADPNEAEVTMLRAFGAALWPEQITNLIDPEVVLPFANLELTKGARKRHGFSGVKEPRLATSATQSAAPEPTQRASTASPLPLVTGSTLLTQRVTPTDIANGRVRVPTRTKSVFPDKRQQIEIELCGHRLRSTPDAEADIAECLIESGNRAEGDALFAVLRDRTPDDPWLYSSAGFAYRGVDDREALRWLLDGIDVAITTGDHDQVVAQLLEMAIEQWERLGESVNDEVVARVEEFIANWTRPSFRSKSWPDAPSPTVLQPCEHCGFDPDRPPPAPDVVSTASGTARKMPLSLAWFPAGEWELAIDRWPDLLDELPADHRSYSHRIEARLKWLTKQVPGHRLSVSPLSVAELVDAHGADANTGEARSSLAAEVARSGRALDWPPARNDRCWCGSDQKYKKCCGPVPPAEDEE